MSDTRGEAPANSDLVEGIARAIYEQRPVLSSGPAIGWSVLVALKDNDQCTAVLRRHREGARAALDYISSLGMVVVPSSVLTPRDDSHLVAQLRDTASRIVDVDDHLVVHLAADALEAREVRPVGEWQPIETAPRDGSSIYLRGSIVAHYMPRAQFPTFPADWRPETPRTEWTLTGWRPLPDISAVEQPAVDRGEAPNNTPKVRG